MLRADLGRDVVGPPATGLLRPAWVTAAVTGLLAGPPPFRAGLGGTGIVTVAGLVSLFMLAGRVKVMTGLDEIRSLASSLYRDFTSLTVPNSMG